MLIVLTGCAKQNLQFDIENAARIKIFSGSLGKYAEITDEETIAHITDNINGLSFEKNKSSKNTNGFAYSLTWYDNDNNVIDGLIIMDETRIGYDDYFYDKDEVNGSIDIEYIKGLFADLVE